MKTMDLCQLKKYSIFVHSFDQNCIYFFILFSYFMCLFLSWLIYVFIIYLFKDYYITLKRLFKETDFIISYDTHLKNGISD